MLAIKTQPHKDTEPQKRVTIKNILFATDFSSSSHLALPYAAGLARSFGAKLYTMHVQEAINYAVPPQTWQSVELTREMEEKFLSEVIHHDFPDVEPHILHGQGGVRWALEFAVDKYAIDLIVVGTRGRTGIGKVIMGSEAEEMLRHAKCPVLVVGPHVCAKYERLRGRMASILFATDFGESSLEAAPIAVSLAEEYQSKLTLLHVVQDRDANDLAAPSDFGETAERRLRSLVPEEANLWCDPHVVVEKGDPAEGILEVARRSCADLIVLGVHKPDGFPGAATHLAIATVHKVITRAECPILAVKAKDTGKPS
jgi:nucleotide-binding universal stress UspA family protein